MTTDFMDKDTQYEEQSGGTSDGYARIYWMNGTPRDKTPGRFWAFPDWLVDAGVSFGAPWKQADHTFSDGNSKPIVAASALHVAPICWRQQNFLKDDSGGVASWLPLGKRGKFGPDEGVCLEMLCLVEGLSEPVVLSAKSIKTAMAWLATILPEYRKLRDAVKQSRGGKAVPPWWFWLAIRSAIDPQTKQPIYEKTIGTMVTPPTWVLPGDLASRETWKAMYVGNDMADIGEAAYAAARDWARQAIGDSRQPAETAAAPAGRNVPQPIEDDGDMPF
jgi:hypothetical protein